MQSDFTIITHKFPQNRDLTIIPIADVHLGAAEHLAAEWIKLVEYVRDTPDVYVTLGGDLINNATRSSISNILMKQCVPANRRSAWQSCSPLFGTGFYAPFRAITNAEAAKTQTMTAYMI